MKMLLRVGDKANNLSVQFLLKLNFAQCGIA